MKIISNYIKNLEQNKDNNNIENNSQLFPLLKNWIINDIINISQNENYTKIIKAEFRNYLIIKKIIDS